MKPLLVPLVSFMLCFAIGGGAGAVLMRPAAAPADSTHADSAAAHGAPAGSASETPHAADASPPDSATLADDPHAADPGRVAPAATAPTTHIAGAGGPPAAPSGPVTVESLVRAGAGATVSMRPDGTLGADRAAAPGTDYERMARLLSKMPPRDAARTIEQLGPDQAARALSLMADKQAAAVLQQLAPEKAAVLLQAALALVPRGPQP